MEHATFGKIRYRDGWGGHAPLPRFAAVGRLPDPAPLTPEDEEQQEADAQAALDGVVRKMEELLGPVAGSMLGSIDREMAREEKRARRPKTEKQLERERKEAEREAKQAAREAKARERLAAGLFPFTLDAPQETDPTPHQEAAFRHLLANQDAVYAAVEAGVWESWQNAFGQEYWRHIASLKPAASLAELAGQWAVNGVSVSREHHDGLSYLTFDIDATWRDEHGLVVVYHPRRETQWSTYDGEDDLRESDEPVDDPDDFEESPSAELVHAVLGGEDARARELIAGGMDINALAKDECPPLWVEVDQLEVEGVRRLLQYGADPNLMDEGEKETPLQHARKMYKEMGFGPGKKKGFVGEMMEAVKGLASSPFADVKNRLDQIIALLEAAGGK